ncbi:glycosyltransferase family 2 protein [Aporhodopirellula aestuarii]|uniref:Glycosyltransferase family 2 protein n=1 Tax=Aporhodopirellula aestuarii TaxID=2950107 RepID=A0ABT0UF69_9BACT|nr:glycosyltransferase family A protein [Aporhodopirellula aestuarii]MCM2374831.1 glycosyltransferase family 2 protein [Aporhodopirellula aestuarii]
MSHPDLTISVVIPVYNAAATIRRAVDSVLAQTFVPLEIVVVDDGSCDSTASIVSQYGAAVRLICQENSGTASARNTGIEHSRGEWIAFLDADDYWDQQKLAKQVEVIKHHAEVGLIASDYHTQLPDRIDREWQRCAPESWCDRVLTSSDVDPFLLGTRFWTGTILVKRTALGDDRFVSGLEPAEDRDLWVRLTNKTSVWLIPEPLATCVLEAGSISRVDIHKDCNAMLAVIDRHPKLLGVLNRSVWRSYTFYRWAAMETRPISALGLLIKSFCVWPASLSQMPTMQTLGRSRRLIRIVCDLVVNACRFRGVIAPRRASE